jgi:hypothetical protein
VSDSEEAEAEELLQWASILEISAEEASAFLGGALPDVPGARPYLTRALYLNRQTYMFQVYTLGDKLLVYHGTLGRSPMTMKRQALVLQLGEEPAAVFLYCSMAE